MLPDSDFTDAQKAVMADKRFTCVPVSNEAVGFGVCARSLAGRQKTGPSHSAGRHHGQCISADDIEYAKEHSGTDDRHCRGSLGDGIWFVGPMAFTTEPILKDLQVAYTVINKTAEVTQTIRDAQLSAEAWLRPTAVLLAGEVIFEEA